MEWLTDPTVWLGLTTLILLEIILGIDNLIFIAILADKLPSRDQNAARQLGLGLALLLRLALLAGVFWLTTLTAPLFAAFGHGFSGRDLILLGGGLFLLLKATVEIHERLENEPTDHREDIAHTSFAAAVAQIVVLDAVFSVDSILTAVGMTDQLGVMMVAVIIAMAIMFVASKPLTEFVSAHPPLIILCLGFLLMVGFSLVAEGVGFHIPKGYLYAAIGFSVLIEMFNQIGLRNRKRWSARIPRRQRVAQAVLRLLGGVPARVQDAGDPNVDLLIADDSGDEVFAPSEKEMIRGVLALADRPISSIMTPRPALLWLDLDDSQESILSDIRNSPHAQLVVSKGSIDEIVGIVRKQDLLDLSIENKAMDVRAVTRAPVLVYEATSILKTLELFKLTPVHMAVVVDEYGSLLGVVTQTDLLEAIAGDLPDPQGQKGPESLRRQDGSFVLDASISIYQATELLGLKELPPGDYHTLAGFVLLQAGKIPQTGDHLNFGGWRFEILEMDGPRIAKLLATQATQEESHD
ncbi:MAG: TerC family protein [Candidatus Binataceae bacterium]